MVVERSPGPVSGLHHLCDGGTGTVAAATERQLLDRFLVARDELAFRAIVARHGPMVAGVCRAVLVDPTDADDAFQATFLVLVERAGSVRPGAPLSPWLHGVARKVALRARANAARRRRRERADPDLVAAAPARADLSAEGRERAALLHAEIDRLSPPERSAILLCDLEGLTHQEAADQLGWPLGTVKSRVARGRDRLRSRLVRRGVTLSGPGLVATLAGEAGAAVVVASALQMVTSRAAVALVAGRRVLAVGLISTPVLHLTQGAVRAMIWTHLKVAALAGAAATIVAVPPLVAYQQQGKALDHEQPKPAAVAGPTVEKAANPPSPVGGTPKAASNPLSGVRTRLAQAAVDSIAAHDRDNSPVFDGVRMTWYHRLAEAQLDEARTATERVQAVHTYLDRIRAIAADRARRTAGLINAGGLPDMTATGGEGGWENLWNDSGVLDAAIKEGQRWLIQVQAGPASVPTPPAVVTAAPKAGGGGEMGFGGGGSGGGASPYSPLPTNTPADEKQNGAIEAILERRIAMPFANETPLGDFVKYIQESTRDKSGGFPAGIPIHVDRQGLQDVDKTMASTISLDLEGVALRTTLKLALMQLNLTYLVDNGLLLIVANTEDGEYSDLLPRRPKPAATIPPGGFQ